MPSKRNRAALRRLARKRAKDAEDKEYRERLEKGRLDSRLPKMSAESPPRGGKCGEGTVVPASERDLDEGLLRDSSTVSSTTTSGSASAPPKQSSEAPATALSKPAVDPEEVLTGGVSTLSAEAKSDSLRSELKSEQPAAGGREADPRPSVWAKVASVLKRIWRRVASFF